MNDSQQAEPPSFAETSFVEMMMYIIYTHNRFLIYVYILDTYNPS